MGSGRSEALVDGGLARVGHTGDELAMMLTTETENEHLLIERRVDILKRRLSNSRRLIEDATRRCAVGTTAFHPTLFRGLEAGLRIVGMYKGTHAKGAAGYTQLATTIESEQNLPL